MQEIKELREEFGGRKSFRIRRSEWVVEVRIVNELAGKAVERAGWRRKFTLNYSIN